MNFTPGNLQLLCPLANLPNAPNLFWIVVLIFKQFLEVADFAYPLVLVTTTAFLSSNLYRKIYYFQTCLYY